MATTYTRGEPDNRPRLVAALQLLTEHYAGFGTGGPEVAAAKLTVASLVTSYAMGQLVRRLVAEGYVRDERAAELLERAGNLEAGRGFVMSNEPDPLKAPLKETLKRAPKAKPAPRAGRPEADPVLCAKCGCPIEAHRAPDQGGCPDFVALSRTFCSVCSEPQFHTLGGLSCRNGHGGAEPMEAPTRTVHGRDCDTRAGGSCNCGLEGHADDCAAGLGAGCDCGFAEREQKAIDDLFS